MQVIIEKLTPKNYVDFLALVNKTRWGNILLPDTYDNSIWGFSI